METRITPFGAALLVAMGPLAGIVGMILTAAVIA